PWMSAPPTMGTLQELRRQSQAQPACCYQSFTGPSSADRKSFKALVKTLIETYARAVRCSFLAAVQTCRAASAFIAAIPMPAIRSGQADSVYAVTSPAATIATLASASFLAERKAAFMRLPL